MMISLLVVDGGDGDDHDDAQETLSMVVAMMVLMRIPSPATLGVASPWSAVETSCVVRDANMDTSQAALNR